MPAPGRIEPDPPPSAPAALPNGTELGPAGEGGLGSLWLVNESPQDALVKIVDAATPAWVRRIVYVQAGSQAILWQIQPGTYLIRVGFGTDWDAARHRFRRGPSYAQLVTPLEFGEIELRTEIRYVRYKVPLAPALDARDGVMPLSERAFGAG